MNEKCAVGGLITPTLMCGLIIVGTGKCGSTQPCVFQKKETSAPATANFPTGSLGEEVES